MGLRAGALIAFTSKPTSVLLALPLGASLWVDRGRRDGRAAWACVYAVAILGVALALFTIGQETEALRTTLDRPFSATRLLGALGLQFQHLSAPATLAHRYEQSHSMMVHLVLGAAATVALCVLAIRWTISRDPRLPWLALAVAAYLPVSNLRSLERFMADSYAYLPSVSIVACVALTWARQHARLSERVGRLLRGVLVAACLSWAALTRVQVESWASSLNLWQDLYTTQPDNPEAIYFYGDALGRAGEADAEWALYRAREEVLERGARVPVLLPVYYARNGDPDRALAWYTQGFESPVRQSDGLYWNYLDFVGAHPAHHPEALDDALRYALVVNARQGTLTLLPAAAHRNLVSPARRLNLEEVVHALEGPDASNALTSRPLPADTR